MFEVKGHRSITIQNLKLNGTDQISNSVKRLSGPAGLGLKLLVWVLAAFIAFAVYQISMVRTDETDRALYKNYSETLITQNKDLITAPPTSPKDLKTIEENSIKILKRAPINDDALLHLAFVYSNSQGDSSSSKFLEFAQSRNARNRNTTHSLLYSSIHAKNYREALTQLNLLFRLKGRNHDQYHNIADAILEQEGGLELIDEALKDAPRWGIEFLKRQIYQSDLSNLYRLEDLVLGYSNNTDIANVSQHFKSLFIERLIHFGDIEHAYGIWKTVKLNNSSAKALDKEYQNSNIIFNTKFLTSDMPSPFNWKYIQNDKIVIEPERSGGVFVTYRGSKPAKVLHQIIPYSSQEKLEVDVNYNVYQEQRDSLFEWRLICADTNKQLLNIPLKKQSLEFSIKKALPATNENGCDFIDVQLWAVPGLYTTRLSSTINQVLIHQVSNK